MLEFSPTGLAKDAPIAARLVYDSDPPYYDFWFGSSPAALASLEKLWQAPAGSYSHRSAHVWHQNGKFLALAFHYVAAEQAKLALADVQEQGRLRGDFHLLQQREAMLAWLFPHVPDNVWYLRTLAVDAASRGQGIGSRILEEIVTVALTHGAQALHTDVDSANRGAVRFYEAQGFELLAETRVPALASYRLPASYRMSKSII